MVPNTEDDTSVDLNTVPDGTGCTNVLSGMPCPHTHGSRLPSPDGTEEEMVVRFTHAIAEDGQVKVLCPYCHLRLLSRAIPLAQASVVAARQIAQMQATLARALGHAVPSSVPPRMAELPQPEAVPPLPASPPAHESHLALQVEMHLRSLRRADSFDDVFAERPAGICSIRACTAAPNEGYVVHNASGKRYPLCDPGVMAVERFRAETQVSIRCYRTATAEQDEQTARQADRTMRATVREHLLAGKITCSSTSCAMPCCGARELVGVLLVPDPRSGADSYHRTCGRCTEVANDLWQQLAREAREERHRAHQAGGRPRVGHPPFRAFATEADYWNWRRRAKAAKHNE